MRCLFLFVFFLLFGPCAPASGQKLAFDHISLNDPRLGKIDAHITRSDSGAAKPLLVYLDGSGNFPIYYRNKSGKYSTSVPLDIQRYATSYRIVLISKPGIPFSDSLRYNESGDSFYPENDHYRRLYSLDWRAGAASHVIDYLLKKMPVNRRSVIVMGFSEGSQVAPRVAVLNKHVTKVICIAGNALDQLFDFILNARLNAASGAITREKAQEIVDSLYQVYGKIYKDPGSTEKTWFGASYKKWSSFSQTTPLDNMLRLDIPILYIAGGRDANQTILGMDYAKLEFIKRGKTNLTYKVYPNCDHYFQDKQSADGSEKSIDRLDEVHQFAMDWANQ